jgi:valyl-tRNA synthetase
MTPYIRALAKLSDARVVERLPGVEAPIAIVGDIRLLLHVEVDKAAERARLDKEIARLEAEAGKSRAKLGSANFVERAPVAVVEQERARLAEFEATLVKLRARRAQLGD